LLALSLFVSYILLTDDDNSREAKGKDMYGYTRDSEGRYVGHIYGEKITAHNKESFYKLMQQAEDRHNFREWYKSRKDRRSTFSRANRILGVNG